MFTRDFINIPMLRNFYHSDIHYYWEIHFILKIVLTLTVSQRLPPFCIIHNRNQIIMYVFKAELFDFTMKSMPCMLIFAEEFLIRNAKFGSGLVLRVSEFGILNFKFFIMY